MSRRSVLLCFAIALLASATGIVRADDADKEKSFPKLVPGGNTRVDYPKFEKGFYMVNPPSNYKASRAWPILFSYRMGTGAPTTYPFRQIIGKEHFIIVGMGYSSSPLKQLKKILETLSKHLNIDRKRIFVGGGFSGGSYASGIINQDPRLFAGALILCAKPKGRTRNPRAFRKKPIFIACGAKGKNLAAAKSAFNYYRSVGAKVTRELWPGVKNQLSTRSPKMKQWLMRHGPLGDVKEKMLIAVKAEKDGKLGQAYAIFKELSNRHEHKKLEFYKYSAKAVERIAIPAGEQLANAQKAMKDKRYLQAATMLLKIARIYEGSELAEDAMEFIEDLEEDPKLKTVLEQAKLDSQADALEEKALSAEKKRRFSQAIKLYGQYLEKFPKATRFDKVKAHLDELKKGKKTSTPKTGKNQTDRECRRWLGMADNYIKVEMPKKAVPYLKKIINKYGKTLWADQARKRLKKIEGKH